jgi:L-alanine-DL-glutamate epimerase-like enolase superfamily enzyme
MGATLDDVVAPTGGVVAGYRPIEFALMDLLGKRAGLPVYALASGRKPRPEAPLQVPCYDTSLYMDDLRLSDDDAAADWMAAEAAEDWARGHRAFKAKVGRGAMHMPLEAGTRRDIAVIRAIRGAIGPSASLMLDANNGYNLGLVKQVLGETADCGIYWMEEPFHEDASYYRALKAWLQQEGLATLIADGEGDASPRLLDWAREGVVDVIQYDIRGAGFSHWLELGPQLDAWGARSAPHHYGEPLGNYLACHLAPAICGFEAVEWDEATLEAVGASAYRIVEGLVQVPDVPGFGLTLDETAFERAVSEGGWRLAA